MSGGTEAATVMIRAATIPNANWDFLDMAITPNAKLTDDEERAKDARLGTRG
jgi:hypothetical protein